MLRGAIWAVILNVDKKEREIYDTIDKEEPG